MRLLLLLLLPLLALTACKSKVSFTNEGSAPDPETGEPAEVPDRFAIHSKGGEIKLGLTDETVYYRLSDQLLADVDQDLQKDSSARKGIGGALAGAVTSGVTKLLRHRMQYQLRDLQDIRYEDGKITFMFEDGTTQTPHIDAKSSDGTSLRASQQAAFAARDVNRFIAAFRAAKRDTTL